MTNNNSLREVLNDSLKLLDSARITFRHSIAICSSIGIKEYYTFEELDHFEALTARFARISDICTQKVMRSIFQLLREDCPTFIDKASFAEKIGMINSADELIVIRDLRNTIAHEYVLEALNEIFTAVVEYSPILDSILESVVQYAKSRNF